MFEWTPSKRADNCFILEHDGKRLDVWKLGSGYWRWTVEQDNRYTDSGQEATLDLACEAALKAAKL